MKQVDFKDPQKSFIPSCWQARVLVDGPTITSASSNGGRTAPLAILRRLCHKLGFKGDDIYPSDEGYEDEDAIVAELNMLVAYYRKASAAEVSEFGARIEAMVLTEASGLHL